MTETIWTNVIILLNNARVSTRNDVGLIVSWSPKDTDVVPEETWHSPTDHQVYGGLCIKLEVYKTFEKEVTE